MLKKQCSEDLAKLRDFDKLETKLTGFESTAILKGMHVILQSEVDGGVLLGSNIDIWPIIRAMNPSNPKDAHQRWRIDQGP